MYLCESWVSDPAMSKESKDQRTKELKQWTMGDLQELRGRVVSFGEAHVHNVKFPTARCAAVMRTATG